MAETKKSRKGLGILKHSLRRSLAKRHSTTLSRLCRENFGSTTPPLFRFFLIPLLMAVFHSGGRNGRSRHDGFSYLLLTMLKMKIGVQYTKKSNRLAQDGHQEAALPAGWMYPAWMKRLGRGELGVPLAAPPRPPTSGTAALSVSA